MVSRIGSVRNSVYRADTLLREATAKIDQAMRETERTTQALAAIVGAAHTQKVQVKWITFTAAAALAVGLLISPFLARLLPFGFDGRVAAFIMQADRWNAGAALMQAQSPQGWRDLRVRGGAAGD